MRRREHLLAGDIRVADDAVLGGFGTAKPEVAVGKADAEVRAGTGEVECLIALGGEEGGPGVERGVVGSPGGHRIGGVDA